jgi:cellulose synthase/poly-beta-1,6-N-acetylglucosamine synthase-like glycosyltransferase
MTSLAILLLSSAGFAAGYYLLLTLAGLRLRPAPAADPPMVTVLIPAHDEEAGLPATLASVRASDYPPGRLRVLVVADNCTDDTAEVARRHGAEVVERFDPMRRGKGFALAAGLPHATGDAVLILDADCQLAPDAVRRLANELATAEAVQAAVRPRTHAGPAGLAAAVGWAVDDGVDAGRTGLGLGVTLRGTGMMFRRELFDLAPWRNFGLAEDAEYTRELRRIGVRVRLVPGAVVAGETPPDRAALATQRGRWRAALFAGGCGPVERLLASKPLVLVHLAGSVAAAGALSPRPLPWAAVPVLTTAFVYLRAGWVAGVRPTGRDLLRAVETAGRLAWLTVAGRAAGWVRTARPTPAG